jgi:hypothetical protein
MEDCSIKHTTNFARHICIGTIGRNMWITSTRKLRENNVEGIDIMQISGNKNVAFINNYSTLSEERHKKI